jgi:hypothetical protein
VAIRINKNITFIHIGKNAGTSITRTVTENLETEFSGRTHDHWSDIPAHWQDRGFAVFRNPYDRAVSQYLFGKRKTLRRLGFTRNTDEVNQKLKQTLERYEQGFEHWLITHLSPVNLLQILYLPKDLTIIHLLLYDNINKEWEKLCHREKWPDLTLSEHNTNPDTEIPYDQYHTEQTRMWIKEHLSADIELYKKLLNRPLQDHR